MAEIKYHKLVRDKIPEIIEKSGKNCETEVLSDIEYLNPHARTLGTTINETMQAIGY